MGKIDKKVTKKRPRQDATILSPDYSTISLSSAKFGTLWIVCIMEITFHLI
jgi:hypothetical protein